MEAMVASVSNRGTGNVVSQRLKQLENENKTGNDSLFKVVNLLTGHETHVPGGAIGRFMTGDYFVEYAGPNEANVIPQDDKAAAQAVADKLLADAQAKADEIIAKAQADSAKTSKKKGGEE